MIDGIYKNSKDAQYITMIHTDNGIECFMVDRHGNSFHNSRLFIINQKTGVIKLCGGISDRFGFDLDSSGRLTISLD